MGNYRLIVVGDQKTPATWHVENVEFLSIHRQHGIGTALHRVLPCNHYSRKLMGYLYAIRNHAELIIDTDDDNIPKSDWTFPEIEGTFQCVADDCGFVNMYQLYSSHKVWPRGLPLRLIRKQFDLPNKLSLRRCSVGIWQGLADEDPDVDAIYRLTDDTPCYFKGRDQPVVLGRNTISPFNSQNTLFRKELFPLLYLPTSVTFRFTDILRGLVAQPIMWLYDFKLGFTNATVVQERNEHDYMSDFVSEVPMYRLCENVTSVVSDAVSANETIGQNLQSAYEALLKKEIVGDAEMKTLQAWLEDIGDLASFNAGASTRTTSNEADQQL